MASVHPAMRGQFGSTEYFMLTMKANDVASRLTIPKKMPEWGDLDIEERFQREINYNRVRKQIAPYLANDPDRFFGALIVAVLNPEGMEFEPADNVLSKAPKLYATAARSFGFVTLEGGEVLVPLDGQHRLAAIQFALSGKDEKQRDIEGVSPNTDLANDDVLLILVRHDDPQRSRKIFNKVNRYAKRTSKAEDLITADDDIIAVISRESVANEIIGSRLVNYRTNTLTDTSECFTTLSTIYEATKVILEENFGRIDVQMLPEPGQQALYRATAVDYWEKVADGVTTFHSALVDKEEGGDAKRREIRKSSLLGKPVAQLALIRTVVRLIKADRPDGSKFSWEEILARVNETDWGLENPKWQRILLNGSRVVSGRQAVLFASRYIAYDLGEPLPAEDLANLEDLYRSHFPADQQATISLPPRSFPANVDRSSVSPGG